MQLLVLLKLDCRTSEFQSAPELDALTDLDDMQQIKKRFGDGQGQILKATLRREATLIERNYFIYIFRVTQVGARAVV